MVFLQNPPGHGAVQIDAHYILAEQMTAAATPKSLTF